MNEQLRFTIKALPTKSGVYVMFGNDGQVIYVGKAKNLKNRVGQYFLQGKKEEKVSAMVESIASLECFVTLAEKDALALESTLIKKYKPFYNILLKDDKSFSYIKVNLKEDFPKFEVTRKIKKDSRKYFGPFFAGVTASEILKALNLAFPIQTHGLKISKNEKLRKEGSSMAFGFGTNFEKGTFGKQQYREIVLETVDFLSGNTEKLEEILTKKMLLNAQNENFEQALLLREKIKMVKKIKDKTIINVPKNLELDAFGVAFDGINAAVSVVVCRNGGIVGIQNFSVVSLSENIGDLLAEFIVQYYDKKLVPKEVLVEQEFAFATEIEEILSKSKGFKVEIVVPKIALKSKFVQMAKENASVHLSNSVMRNQQKHDKTVGALTRLKEKLSLKNLPKRIECFDISNLGGTNSVASMVVFTNGEADKKSYRKFKIQTVDGPNDFLSLQEALSRRLTRLKEKDFDFGPKPDLIVIDGGKGQLSSAYKVLCDFGLENEIDMVSLAKKFEEIFKPNNSFPFMLGRKTQELLLLESLRDEAHRFAITSHKNLRDKKNFSSALDNVEGLGKQRAKKLFQKFLSLEKMQAATLEELMEVEGVGKVLAEKVMKVLQEIDSSNN